MKIFKIFFILFFILLSASLEALEVPYLMGHVNDYAHLLSTQMASDIEQSLKEHEKNTGHQVVVLTIPGLDDEVLEDYSMKVVEKWKLGQKEKDDGVLLLVAAKERKLRIEVGYGLEDKLTDSAGSQIIQNVIVPSFKQGDYNQGIKNGVESIIGVLNGTESADSFQTPQNNLGFMGTVFVSLFFLSIIGLFTLVGASSKGAISWFMYFFLMPFWMIFPSAFLSPIVGGVLLIVYLIGYPILKLMLKNVPWVQALHSHTMSSGSSGHSWGSSGWSSSGGGFSGGGGSFGGGGSSGSW